MLIFLYFYLFLFICQYELTLTASDSLNDNDTNIRDVNDMPPVFSHKSYERTLPEELAPPFDILKVDNVVIKFEFMRCWGIITSLCMIVNIYTTNNKMNKMLVKRSCMVKLNDFEHFFYKNEQHLCLVTYSLPNFHRKCV